jgi:hypothetical protein
MLIAKDLTAEQTALEQPEKSKGRGLRNNDDTAAILVTGGHPSSVKRMFDVC